MIGLDGESCSDVGCVGCFFACSFFIVYLDERGNFSLIFKMELNPSHSADDNNITSVSSFGFTFDKRNRFLSIIEYDTQIQDDVYRLFHTCGHKCH